MKVIIMGYGRVGEQVAILLIEEGHQITVIDNNHSANSRSVMQNKIRMVKGVGFDRDVLIQAGIEEADAFAATSSSDNSNIIAARVARNIFHVPKVVARLFDPRRAEIYQRLGLTTISSTTLGAERIRELLIHTNEDPVMTFGRGEVCIFTIETPSHLIGHKVKDLTVPGEIHLNSITRKDQAFIPLSGTEFKAGDSLHLTVLASAIERMKMLLGYGEGE
ncbi:MAG: potassium transporter TrkA [Chloroflexi bacterium HGW-Chloroflexi-10]|nr:MAG: potassium transporter TrkA [Chloroflexi bacterium HGW-Chloroflexi-10]